MSSGEKRVALRTAAISACVRFEFVIMNSNSVWSGLNIIMAAVLPRMSSAVWISGPATQASPPRDQSSWRKTLRSTFACW
jgi:hypothetical protein